MRVPTNIFRRGAIFYHRQVVPKDLLAITGCRELKLSLRTRCPHTARRRGAVVQLRAETLFAYLRRKTSLLPLQAQTAIKAFYVQSLEADAAERRSGNPRPAAHDEAQRLALDSVEQDIIVALRRGNISLAEDFMDSEFRGLDESERSSAYYGELCQSVLRSSLEVIRRLKEREEGNWGGIPSDPLLLAMTLAPTAVYAMATSTMPISAPATIGTPVPPATTNVPTMEELIEAFFREKRKASGSSGDAGFGKYEREFRASLEWFRQYFDGYWAPGAYQRHDLVKYKDALLDVPKNFQKFFPGRTIKEAIIGNRVAHRPTLNTNTINNKRLGDLKTFFRWLHSNAYITTNPIDGVSATPPSKNASTRQKRYPFSIGDLKKIFQSQAFLDLSAHRGLRTDDDLSEAHKYWLPLLALFTGCRMAELAQLQCADLVTLEGSLFLRITEEVKAETKDRSLRKSVKNAGSDRLMPVHPELIKLGFDKFVAAAKASTNDRLFPGCERSKADGSFTPYSKFFARFLKRIGVKKDQMLAFHSFRHNFEDAMREAGLDQHIRYRLAGRADNHSSAGYGNGHRPARLLEEISKIQYPSLDLIHLEVTEG
ncbi:tyrosine-type recombinase/integrase [Parvibaculum sedimenti]|uniref:Tyrosine-type recombinase/integrase n=1 Tax=Parvibaculum sedimenti TaxID=2608632 RepID=A0A6N6VFG6_9HYPH|nr:site-specific integrase [Parvibaculum sedimenti]KAB7739539.1 tyrosine-type recombinase/integrase [Parvibaculum sedimenti]